MALEPWNSLSELVYFLYPEQPVLVFGTPRDNHNMGKGRHSQRGTFHNPDWQICSVECFHRFHISISFITE
jgi:hypothetical protein